MDPTADPTVEAVLNEGELFTRVTQSVLDKLEGKYLIWFYLISSHMHLFSSHLISLLSLLSSHISYFISHIPTPLQLFSHMPSSRLPPLLISSSKIQAKTLFFGARRHPNSKHKISTLMSIQETIFISSPTAGGWSTSTTKRSLATFANGMWSSDVIY